MWLKNLKAKAPFLAFGLFLILVYGPYVLQGEFSYDDWSVGNLALDCPGLIDAYRCYLPSFSNRPLAPIYYSLTTNLFGVTVAGYIISNLMFWLGAVFLLGRLFKRRFDSVFAWVFISFAVVPTIATTVIFSPGMQSIGSVAIFIWSLSFWFLEQYCAQKKQRHLVISYLLVLASLLTYEISFPLLSLSVTWPAIRSKTQNWRLTRRNVLRYGWLFVAPLVGVILLVLFYQKLLVTHFLPDISRFRIHSGEEFYNISISIRNLLGEIVRSDLPALMASGLKTLWQETRLWSWVALVVGGGSFWKAWHVSKKTNLATALACSSAPGNGDFFLSGLLGSGDFIYQRDGWPDNRWVLKPWSFFGCNSAGNSAGLFGVGNRPKVWAAGQSWANPCLYRLFGRLFGPTGSLTWLLGGWLTGC